MSNVFLLLKTYLLNFVGSLLKKRKEPKTYVGFLLIGFFSVLMVFMFTINAITSTEEFIKQANNGVKNAEYMSIYVNATLSILMLLFVTIMKSFMPSKSRDNDLLLSLPFTKIQIIVSKAIYNYLVDFVLFLSILLPSYIVYYCLVDGASFWIIIRGFSFILIMPLLSNALSTFIGIFTNKLAIKCKYYSIIQTIITIVLIGVYLVLNFSIQGYMTKITGTVDGIISEIWLMKILMEYLLFGNVVGFFGITIVIVLLFILSILLLSNGLGKLEKKYENKNKELTFKSNNLIITLIKKELKQYFNCTPYIVNTIIGGVLYLGAIIAAFVLGLDRVLNFLNALPLVFRENKEIIPLMMLSVLIGTYVITGCSISLEGKTFWLLISNPIKPITIIFSKILANLVLTFSFILISIPLLLILVPLNSVLFYILIPILSTCLSTTLGILINLYYPKMEWEREEYVIKQSLSVALTLFLPIIILIFPYVVYFTWMSKYYTINIFMIFNSLYLLLMIGILVLTLIKKGDKLLISVTKN